MILREMREARKRSIESRLRRGAKGELRAGQIYPKTSIGRFQVFLYAVIPTGKPGKPSKQTTGSRMNTMTRVDVSEQELEVFLNVADRLGIGVRDLLEKDVPFREMELAGHELGRAIAQMTTERLALARAERLTGPQPCPTCDEQCPLEYRARDLTTGDGPVRLLEPVCECSTCRRAFFPSAS